MSTGRWSRKEDLKDSMSQKCHRKNDSHKNENGKECVHVSDKSNKENTDVYPLTFNYNNNYNFSWVVKTEAKVHFLMM